MGSGDHQFVDGFWWYFNEVLTWAKQEIEAHPHWRPPMVKLRAASQFEKDPGSTIQLVKKKLAEEAAKAKNKATPGVV